MSSKSRFEYGDLVFAKCTKNKPWPAKITRVLTASMFRVDFFNHNSLGIVDLLDVEELNEKTVGFYKKKYENYVSKSYILLRQAIQMAERELKRRIQIQSEEVQEWKSKKPTEEQKERLERRLNAERDRPVDKPRKDNSTKEMLNRKKDQKRNQNYRKKLLKKREDLAKKNKASVLHIKNQIITRSKAIVQINDEQSQNASSVEEQLDESYNAEEDNEIQQKEKKNKKSKRVKNKQKKIKKVGKRKGKKGSRSTKNRKRNDQQSQILQISDGKQISVGTINFQNLENSQILTVNQSLVSNGRQFQQGSLEQSNLISSELIQNKQSKQINDKVGSLQILSASHTFSQAFNGIFPERTQSFLKDISYLNTSFQQCKPEESFYAVPSLSFSKVLVTDITEQQKPGQNVEKMVLVEPEIIEQSKGMQRGLISYGMVDLGVNSKQREESDRNILFHNDTCSDLSFPFSEIDEMMREACMGDDNTNKNNQPQNVKAEQGLADTNQLVQQKLVETHPAENHVINQDGCVKQEADRHLVSINQNEVSRQSNAAYQLGIRKFSLGHINSEAVHKDDINEDLIAKQMKRLVAMVLQDNQTQQQIKVAPVQQNNNQRGIEIQKQKEHQQGPVIQNQPQILEGNQFFIKNPLFNLLTQPVQSQVMSKKIVEQMSCHKDLPIFMERPKQTFKKPVENISFEDPDMFERIYGDYSIPRNDFTLLVKGIPKLKRQLAEANKNHIVLNLNRYYQTLSKFVASNADGLQMWQKQIFIAVMDSDLLDMSLLVASKTLIQMMNFIIAFETSLSRKRAECHLQYLLTSNRLDLYMSRYFMLRQKLILRQEMKIPRELQTRYGRSR